MNRRNGMLLLTWAGLCLLLFSAGCRQQTASDGQLQAMIQQAITNDPVLAGQTVQVTVNNKVASISGTVDRQDQIQEALRDASIPGIVQVVNQVSVNQAAATPPPNVQTEPPQPSQYYPPQPRRYRQQAVRQAAPLPVAPPQPVVNAPPPPPQPVVTTVTLPAGTVIPVRVTEALTSATAQPNQIFHGTVAADVPAGGLVAIRQGTPVVGRVAQAKDAAHFAGSSLLSVELTEIDIHGKAIPVVTDQFSQQGQGRGKNTAEKVGGGGLGGMLLGALGWGRKGAAIGAASGAGAGTAANAMTRGQQVTIASEQLVNFTLQSPISVTASGTAGTGGQGAYQPQLQQRPQ